LADLILHWRTQIYSSFNAIQHTFILEKKILRVSGKRRHHCLHRPRFRRVLFTATSAQHCSRTLTSSPCVRGVEVDVAIVPGSTPTGSSSTQVRVRQTITHPRREVRCLRGRRRGGVRWRRGCRVRVRRPRRRPWLARTVAAQTEGRA